MSIKIDFHGSTHGHFLEYVTNVYIMQTTPSARDIFKPPTYSAHNPDDNYLNNRIIRCGHFSSGNNLKEDDIVIRISIPRSDDMFFVAATNLMHKAGDIGIEKQFLSIPDAIRNISVDLRNNWYSKFNERNQYAKYYNDFAPAKISFNFPFESFFSFTDFCISLTKLATFLNQTFFPDQSLYELWARFIRVNQGWQSNIKCKNILDCIFAGRNEPVDCTIIEQAWLNFKLTQMCKMYQGSIFEDNTYPSNTWLIYQEVHEHLKKLRHAS